MEPPTENPVPVPTCRGTKQVVYHWMEVNHPLRMKMKPCVETLHLTEEGFCPSRECCPKCYELDSNAVGIADKQHLLEKHMKLMVKHYVSDHGYPTFKSHTGNGTHKGAFAFTLTKSPKDDLSIQDMIIAVKKVLNQKSNPVKSFCWYMEFKPTPEDPQAHPHIHGMYETISEGRIETKHWKRAWPIWDPMDAMGFGFRGGYHRPVRHNEGYSDYIQKDEYQNNAHGAFNLPS